MFTIAVTGGICSGKTTLSSYLARKYNLAYINTDRLARDLEKQGTESYRQIVKTFGSPACYRNGRLNRRKLAQIVFSDPAARQRLNRILHPEIIRVLQKQLVRIRQRQSATAVIVEVPLLFEARLEKFFDVNVLVSAAQEIQIERLKRYFDLSRQEALERIAAQMSVKEKEKKADFVIHNANTKTLLERKADRLWEKIRTKSR